MELDLRLPDPKDNLQATTKILDDHLLSTGGKVITRFPPEPNGYLHLGHVKAMFINFEYARKNNGICYLRFDDTNPSKEKHEFIESIIEDVTWMGYNPYKITYTSDYFDQLYTLAKDLIRRDKAYVCELSAEQIKIDRKNKVKSPYRNRPIEESLRLFESMQTGVVLEGSMVLRLKADMESDNPNMRDLVAYRIINSPHPRTGTKWKVYPTYDYSHCIVDSLENITHSLCSMEFQTRNQVYHWILEALDLYSPPQIEYSRLNVTNTLLSKRKLLTLIEKKIVTGWDDPRLPTIKGLRKRGYTPDALKRFASKVGVSIGTSNVVIKYNLLEECLRQELDMSANRIMGVMNPIRVTLVNYTPQLIANVLEMPRLKDKSPVHMIPLGNHIYIDGSDFRLTDEKGYYRLAPNKVVRLKYSCPIRCIGYKCDGYNEIVEIMAEILDERTYTEKIKGTITWVEDDSLPVEIRTYSHLFPTTLDETAQDWITQLETLSMNIYFGRVNRWIEETVKLGHNFQMERFGYVSIASVKPWVLNMSVGLKENKDY